MSKRHSIQHRHGLLPVSIILDRGDSWSKNKVLRALQGILGPLISRFSVRIKVVDEMNEGCCQCASFLEIKQVRGMCLKQQELVDRVDNEMGEDCCIRNRERVGISSRCSLE